MKAALLLGMALMMIAAPTPQREAPEVPAPTAAERPQLYVLNPIPTPLVFNGSVKEIEGSVSALCYTKDFDVVRCITVAQFVDYVTLVGR